MNSPTKEAAKELSENLENWMANLPQKLRSIPIIYLAIPGSHDSCTAAITSKSDLAPDAEPILQSLKFLGPLLKFFMANWSRTQAFNTTTQLLNGVRYFDFRLATKEGTDDIYLVHGLYSEKIEDVLKEIAAFLETHPQEIVILDNQHFYEFTQNDHEKLSRLLATTFGHKLMPYTSHMEHLSLEYMTTQFRYQVIAIYRSDALRFGQPFLWPSSSFPTPWPNTMSISTLLHTLDDGIKNRPPAIGYVSQLVLTPTTWFVVKHLFATLREKCAIALKKHKHYWIAKNRPGKGGVNIIIADFVDLQDGSFPREVIGLNAKLLNDTIQSPNNYFPMTPIDK